MSWLGDMWDEYFGGSPKEIAEHVLFKNEPITMMMEAAEVQTKRDPNASNFVKGVGSVSESMDRNPAADAKMAVGFGAAWITGGASVPLGLSGVQTIVNEAGGIYQGPPSEQTSSTPTLPTSQAPTSLLDQIVAFLEELIDSVLGLFGFSLFGQPTSGQTRVIHGQEVDVSGRWSHEASGAQYRAYVAGVDASGEEVIVGQRRQGATSGSSSSSSSSTPTSPSTSSQIKPSTHSAVPIK